MKGKEIRIMPAAEQPVESGPLRFGDDWPGVFIRGDDAANYAYHLHRVLKTRRGGSDEISRKVVQGLLDALRSCDLMIRFTEHIFQKPAPLCGICDHTEEMHKLMAAPHAFTPKTDAERK
jgi:hypothetical protein